MKGTVAGTFAAIAAAVTYGTNPLGALFLYEDGANTNSVLFYRFFLAAGLLAAGMPLTGEKFSATRRELSVSAVLGVLFAVSSLTYYRSFLHMDAGVASTLLFVYPIMVAVIMAIFFGEKIPLTSAVSVAVAFVGVALLCGGNGTGEPVSALGVFLVMISSLTYAVYIVVVNRAKLQMSPMKTTFFALIFCAGTIAAVSLFDGNALQFFETPRMWLFAGLLALFPTFFSLIFMTIAARTIGSTPTAILGALEPLTAVVIGVCVFGEKLSTRLVLGIALVLAAVILLVGGKYLRSARYRLRAKNSSEIFSNLKK